MEHGTRKPATSKIAPHVSASKRLKPEFYPVLVPMCLHPGTRNVPVHCLVHHARVHVHVHVDCAEVSLHMHILAAGSRRHTASLAATLRLALAAATTRLALLTARAAALSHVIFDLIQIERRDLVLVNERFAGAALRVQDS